MFLVRVKSIVYSNNKKHEKVNETQVIKEGFLMNNSTSYWCVLTPPSLVFFSPEQVHFHFINSLVWKLV